MTQKNSLQARITLYKQRRDKIREQFPNWNHNCPEYREKVKILNKGIRRYGRTIGVIKKREEKIWEFNDLVCEFFDILTLRHVGHSKKRETMLAKEIFCKITLEAGLGSLTLAEFLNVHKTSVYNIRKRFNKELRYDVKTNEVWQKFKRYMTDKPLKQVA